MDRFLTLVFVFVIGLSFAGNSEDLTPSPKFKASYDSIEKAIELMQYNLALPIISELIKNDSLNANLQYLIGMCYINAGYDKSKAIPFLEKAVNKIDKSYKFSSSEVEASPASLYYLGRAYHSTSQYDKAIESYNRYKSLGNFKAGVSIKEIDHLLEMCNNGKNVSQIPSQQASIKHLDSKFENNKAKTLLYISADNTNIVFATGSYSAEFFASPFTVDGMYSCKYNSESKQWGQPVSLDNSTVEKPIGKTNLQQLVYSKQEGNKSNLYIAYLIDGVWSKSEKLDAPINDEKSSQVGACLSDNGNTLYFISNREGGYGGYDIYKSTRMSSGKWSNPQNLGPQINTPFDEASPYMLSDAVTLYFSSKGHNSIGGYDVFTTTLSEEGFWSKAENVGPSINSADDDLFYTVSPDEKKAYFSAMRSGDDNVFAIYEMILN